MKDELLHWRGIGRWESIVVIERVMHLHRNILFFFFWNGWEIMFGIYVGQQRGPNRYTAALFITTLPVLLSCKVCK